MLPSENYARRRAERQASKNAAENRYAWVSNLRVAVFLVLLALAWFGYRAGAGLWWAAPALVVFLVLIVWHERVYRARQLLTLAVDYYARGEMRLTGAWVGSGVTGDEYVPAQHPYAYDVDAFGKGSLFQLLAEARTHSGERTLAAWLLAPASTEEILRRQAAVRELAPDVDLREKLSLHGNEARAELDLDGLRAWAEAPPVLSSVALRIATRFITLLSLAAIVAWAMFEVPIFPLLGCAIFAVIIERSVSRQTSQVTARVTRAVKELRALMHVLSCFSGKQATAPWLSERYARFAGAEKSLARLVRLLDWLESRRNQLFAPIAYVLLWTPNFSFFLEDWRRKYGKDVPAWLEAAGALEAISALARQSYEHPDDTFPEIVSGPARLETVGAKHPLMREDKCVANDVTLSPPLQLLLVSGSNMSGKSTLLRTLGLNAVIALAGGTVRAKRFLVTPLQVAATLRVQDSLHDGASRFYAEIARLKVVSDSAVRGPTLFLLDEILSGTNSHDRRIGTEAVVRSLLAKGAVGLVTTHDLALTEIVATLDAKATNVHFEDQMTGATLAFDYTMRPGVVQKSNAIALMRAVGLEV